MTSRPPIHLNVHLPELSPTQAELLWEVLSDLTAALWDAYADDLIEVEQQRQHLLDMEEQWAGPEDDSGDAVGASEPEVPTSPLTSKPEPDPDL